MTTYDRILQMADQLDATAQAQLAGELLNMAGVNRDTWREFADALDDTNHGELLGWAEDEPDRTEGQSE